MSSSVTVSSILGDISQYVVNPAAIQRRIIQAFGAINDGTIDIVDATNAFVYSLEASACNTAAFVQEARALTRQQYAVAATETNDLYLHMSDTDYVNMFALPSTATFTVMIQESLLLNALVLDPTTGIEQVTIPRNTVFNAVDTPFSLQYPINIRRLQHGGLQAVYDATVVSPLLVLGTNVIDLETVIDTTGVRYVRFQVPTQQFNIVSLTNDVDSTGGFTTTVPFSDQFYYCRVYRQDSASKWVEMAVTYTDQVYDASKPTAVLMVNGQQLICKIPLVYVTNRLVRGKIRIDVYQTKGPISVHLGNYNIPDFTAEWKYLDSADATPAVAALAKLTNMAVWSRDITIGGRNALSFEELRSRVMLNSVGPRNIPITSAQMQNLLTDEGYTIVKNIDSITQRSFWATKVLPSPTEANSKDTNTFTPAAATMITLVSSMDQDAQAYGVTQHATGITITSKALFQTVNGKTALVSGNQYAQLTALALSEQAKALNDGSYASTPFYYVLDNSRDIFAVRPYFMDSPSIHTRSFIQENATTGLQVSIGANYSISKTSTGYRLLLTTKSNDAYQALLDSQVFCQLEFTSSSTPSSAYLKGVQQPRADGKGERTFLFDISTNYDINKDDLIALTSFQMFGNVTAPRGALKQKIKVLFGTTSPMPSTYVISSIDAKLGAFQLGTGAVGLTHEELDVWFGYALTNLWNNYRSFSSEIQYQTYPHDVPAVYEKDVYLKDPLTGATFTVVNDQIQYNKLHSAGDPILDTDGQPTFAHRAGDYVLDTNTQLPLPVADYQTRLKRSLDIFAIDAVYAFANDPITTTYMAYIKSMLLSWITQDLVDLNNKALEKTTIYFYPKIAKGSVIALINENVEETIEAAQNLVVTLYLSRDKYLNTALKSSLEVATIKTIGTYFAANSTVSTSGVQNALLSVYGSDVIEVSVNGLGARDGDVVITLTDSSTQLSIAKALAVQANDQMAVQEKVTINILLHDNNSY